jgi:seryl-tRNA synthetase
VEDVVKLDEQRRATSRVGRYLAESNKLSKDIGEMMKNGENPKPLSKRKTVLNKEKSEISRNSGRTCY